jgi:hypothetical protein
VGIFLPRLLVSNSFFIQDEQPWINRSQVYVNSLLSGDFEGAVQYPLSNHPAIPLMTVVGPVMNMYAEYNGLSDTYEHWSLDDKREAAVWARYVWGIACSIALLLLYLVIARMQIFLGKQWAAGLTVVLLGLEPWIWGISRSVSVDVLMAIGVVGMLASAVVAFETRSRNWVLISGAWFGLAFISKSPALITAPFAILLASYMPTIKQYISRGIGWLFASFSTAVLLWPPFILHPFQRLTDVLARAELHSTVQEIYTWPGIHPPFFLFTLSAFATVGCILYLWMRIRDIRRGIYIFPSDILLIAGLFHALILLYLHGDHARKNLPVLALLACIGAIGWVMWCTQHKMKQSVTVLALITLQAIFVWPYFPHVITSYNTLFPSIGGKQLLVDVGNGSRIVADYINNMSEKRVWAIPISSLITPYVDVNKREHLRPMPRGGELASLDPSVTHIIIPASLPTRIVFDTSGKRLLEELSSRRPEATLFIRDVPLFLVYSVR